MAKNKSSVSKTQSYEAIGDFWDKNDFTEFDDLTRSDIHFTIQDTVRIEAHLLASIEKVAAERGVSSETLINLWLHEKVQTISILTTT